MIHLAMRAIAEDMNVAFRRQKGDDRDRIILSSLQDQQGNAPKEGDNKIYFFLTHVAEEKNVGAARAPDRSPGPVPRVAEPVHLNLHVMFAAMYTQYEIGLQVLSEVIGYLRGKPIFDQNNTKGMDPSLDRLVLHLMNLNYAEQSYLWGSLGLKYAPSVLYSMRLLTIAPDRILALEPSVTNLDASAQSKGNGLPR